MSTRRARHLRIASAVVLAALLGWVAWLNACASPLRIDPLERRSPAPVADQDLDLARTFAPWIYHEVHPSGGRQDLPAPIDFDGNLDGDDNWESFPRCELPPTLYYAHRETATHHFLAYHVFHPRDWETLDLGLQQTHEGDGENLAVVVDKATLRPILLFTQAHYRGGAYANGAFADGARELRGPFLAVDDEGRPSAAGTHAAVFIQSKGHGIYGALGSSSRVAVLPDGEARFERRGLVLRPALPGEAVGEPALDAAGPVPYRLESTLEKFWRGVRDGSLIGPGRTFDGPVPYADAQIALELPKFHRGDRFSGPLGSSRGISPFAVDFGWDAGTLGALFFDPAGRYAAELGVPEPWGLEYVDGAFGER